MIDRKKVVRRNNPIYTQYDKNAILSVGNGNFAFSADITGLQTFYGKQKKANLPLCTMAQWGWHTRPAGAGRDTYYKPGDVEKMSFDLKNGKKVSYAFKCQKGNEEIYHWLRENPHKMSLARIAFFLDEKEIDLEEITDTTQELDLYEGVLRSDFVLRGSKVHVDTVCSQEADVLGFRVRCDKEIPGLSVKILFPYGASDITGADWKHKDWHKTELISKDNTCMRVRCSLDQDEYFVNVSAACAKAVSDNLSEHEIDLSLNQRECIFTVGFCPETGESNTPVTFDEVLDNSREEYRCFWNTTGIIDFENAKDPRARELERREILSLYLLRIQSCGTIPPQETGLTCNSWYGKPHLEMYVWHCAWAPFWNDSELVMDSLNWYKEHLDQARENAACNGYHGARWPKMVDADAVDSPSPVATLLIWQQPHILYMLEMVYQCVHDESLLRKYWAVVKETADFMCDFAVYNEESGEYELLPPLIPAQEVHNASTTKNPTFELEYWRFGLEIAARWAERLGESEVQHLWTTVLRNMKESSIKDGVYLACESCPDTFTRFNRDHPSMLAAYGILDGERIDSEIMGKTLDRVLEGWEYPTMWGWDFAMIAMTAVRLHRLGTAIDILLMDTQKNYYAANGNNYQILRPDLPLYLPGNGGLLWALAMMTAGYADNGNCPGFPKDGTWDLEYENIHPFPY